MNNQKPHVLERLQERYPGPRWDFEDLREIEAAIRDNKFVFAAEADPGHRVVCVRYGHPEPLLFVVETNHGRLITALPAEARSCWAGRAYLEKTSSKSTTSLPFQKGTTYAT